MEKNRSQVGGKECYSHRWKTIQHIKREGTGKDYSLHFLRKCMNCEKEAIKIYYPATFIDMFNK